jgi:hypothetical protein
MKRHNGHRGVPGFHKRAAIIFSIGSTDDLPQRVGGIQLDRSR